jgi:hypothetical protein
MAEMQILQGQVSVFPKQKGILPVPLNRTCQTRARQGYFTADYFT